ncbi:MAG: pirin family protein [Chloroflexota bacterium]
MLKSRIQQGFAQSQALHHFPADTFPSVHPVDWLHSHFAVGGWSPLQRLGNMLTAHMTQIAPHSGFTWHPHRGLEIYTWVLEGTIHHEDTTGGKGDIRAGELQRMFSGEWIEHQELNQTDQPVRVIQIWFVADPTYIELPPHYEQVDQSDLPTYRSDTATTYHLIGAESPVESHVDARIAATVVAPGGTTPFEPPAADEDLFLYVTDGQGWLRNADDEAALGQYDVILARHDAPAATFTAGSTPLHFLSFYLPRFLSE